MDAEGKSSGMSHVGAIRLGDVFNIGNGKFVWDAHPNGKIELRGYDRETVSKVFLTEGQLRVYTVTKPNPCGKVVRPALVKEIAA